VPTSDALAWHFARHRTPLARTFSLCAPDPSTIVTLLDKERLHAACTRVGLTTPATVVPRSEAELADACSSLSFPVLLKPRTQVLLSSGSKGGVFANAESLKRAWRAFVGSEDARAAQDQGFDDTRFPLVQELLPEAASNILSVAGFVPPPPAGSGTTDGPSGADEALAPEATLASRKILQRPRRLGIGLCFESTDVDPGLARKLFALARSVGFFGIFEAEFIVRGEHAHLIDFNPRTYSQMALEEARGLPLSWSFYLAALDVTDGPARALQALRDAAAERRRAAPMGARYRHGFLLSLAVAGQRAAARFGGRTPEPWDAWMQDPRFLHVDAVAAPGDPGPAWVDRVEHARQGVRHPRSFVRSLAREDDSLP
jgi:predicted ATP-grasp superfamily ATP-dependent carboligase